MGSINNHLVNNVGSINSHVVNINMGSINNHQYQSQRCLPLQNCSTPGPYIQTFIVCKELGCLHCKEPNPIHTIPV